MLSGTEVTVPVCDEAGVIGDREAAHVWLCSLSLHADEGRLSDGRWQEIATSFVAGMGFDGATLTSRVAGQRSITASRGL